ncbi:hypothetical protein ElyMa_006936600 [Elysia marginata]|uniref:Uncharacterized protein n=1 Tax=Elysia marginata TaxID=1093978 RepID=A0AAV4JI09_9GAST|nr:hypothetical protein ElyMa_006936600 [Elysia marginata]
MATHNPIIASILSSNLCIGISHQNVDVLFGSLGTQLQHSALYCKIKRTLSLNGKIAVEKLLKKTQCKYEFCTYQSKGTPRESNQYMSRPTHSKDMSKPFASSLLHHLRNWPHISSFRHHPAGNPMLRLKALHVAIV